MKNKKETKINILKLKLKNSRLTWSAIPLPAYDGTRFYIAVENSRNPVQNSAKDARLADLGL